MYKAFLLGIACSFFFYIILAFLHKKWFSRAFIGDTSWHFLMVQEFKENSKYEGIPKLIMRDGLDTYPKFFHWLCSFFNLKTIKKKQFLPNLLISLFIHGFLCCYIFYIFSKYYSGNAFEKTIIFTLFLFLQPHQYILKGDKILNIMLSERFLAGLSSSFYYLSLYFFIIFQDTFSAFCIIFFGSICWVVSLFSRQAIIFSSVLLSIFTISFVPIGFLLTSYIVATLLNGKYLNKGIAQQIDFLKTYCKFYKNGTFMKKVILSKGYPDFREMLSVKTFGQFLYLFYSRPPIKFFWENPEVLFLFLCEIFINNSSLDLKFFIIPMILYAITASKKFNFIGEGERYPHYLLKFFNPFLFVMFFQQSEEQAIIMSLILLYSLFNIIIYIRYNKNVKIPEKDLLDDILNEHSFSINDTFFCVPHTLGSAVVVRKGCKALSHQGVRFPLKYMKTVVSDPPFLKHEWDEIFTRYSITHVLVDKNMDDQIKIHCDWSYNYSSLNKISENASYILYSVK